MLLVAAIAASLASYRHGRRVEALGHPPVTTVRITRTGTRYHVDGCRYLRSGSVTVPLDEARSRYAACAVCRPPL